MLLLCDPIVTRMPLRESGEPLIDLRTLETLRVDGRLADPAGVYAHLRGSVVNQLATAQTLLPVGVRLLIVEGLRSLTLQRRYFAAHVARLRKAHPSRDESWYGEHAARYISPPDVAPHVTGGAVDLTLCTRDGTELWLGTEINDTDTESCHTASTDISPEAKEHRRILSESLTAVGLINYPTEWWHWSYGDLYWACVSGAPAARYGPIEIEPK
jgi:D-alanyl-D-alanine dipeptidase